MTDPPRHASSSTRNGGHWPGRLQSSRLRGFKKPFSSSKRDPHSFARMTGEGISRGKAIASASACREVLSFRAGNGNFESQTSGGRVIQSHSAKSPRNWSRKIWLGARESSPKRRRLRVARTKSATSYTCRMASCVRCMRGGPGRQGEKEQELESSRQFEDQGQLLLESQHDHQRHHGEPLPSRPPEPFDPAGKAEQSRHERLVSRVSWHGGADARHRQKAREEQLEQKGSLIHASGAHCKSTAIHAGTRRKRPWVPLTRRKHAWSDSSADARRRDRIVESAGCGYVFVRRSLAGPAE